MFGEPNWSENDNNRRNNTVRESKDTIKLFPLSDLAAKNVDLIPENEFLDNGSFREEDDEGYYELLDAFRPPAPRPGYVCNICHIPGHFIQYCPQAPTKTRTPYQGSKQCIGLFICNKCKRQWKSNKSFAEAGQECKKCHVIINPKKQFPLYTPPRKARASSCAYGSGDVNGSIAAANDYFSSPSPPLSPPPNINRNNRNEITSSATTSPPAGALRTQSLTANLMGRKLRFDSVMTTTASLMSDVFCDSALATPSPSPFGAYEFVFDC
uniref:Uncharacterized protein n=1 Tax=Romanomermis culicivorax TaxID=13658 RepID=A0A915JA22_ROMCU